MAYDQEKLKRFENTILSEAEKEINKINDEIKEYEQTELENARQSEYDRIFNVMQQRVRDIQWKYKRQLTRKNLDSKRNAMNLRNKLVEKIFNESENKIIEFSSSIKYKDYLLKLAKKAVGNFDCKGVELLIRNDDTQYLEDIKKILPFEKNSIDKSNKLGGFKVINQKSGLLLDLSIDDKLKSERQKFYENSGFFIVGFEEG